MANEQARKMLERQIADHTDRLRRIREDISDNEKELAEDRAAVVRIEAERADLVASMEALGGPLPEPDTPGMGDPWRTIASFQQAQRSN